MPYLQLDWTDPSTGYTYAGAVLVLDDARVHLAAGQAVLSDSIYGSAALYTANRGAILRETDQALSPTELNTLVNAFVQQLYEIFQARYPGSVIVP
jgi:hypothetical protein